MHCDLSSFTSIQNFFKEFSQVEQSLDICVCNAGIMLNESYEKTEDGFELTWQSNYLGHFLLTELLLPLLDVSPVGGRIVNVSSCMQKMADTSDFAACNDPVLYDRWVKTYARSKMAQVMHAIELTKRLRGQGSRITINACHPGAVNTNILNRIPGHQRYFGRICAPLVWYFLKTDNDGAQTPLFLALSNKVQGKSGNYYSNCADTSSDINRDIATSANCEQLYEKSLLAVSTETV